MAALLEHPGRDRQDSGMVERIEGDDLIKPVEELGAEDGAQRSVDVTPLLRVLETDAGALVEAGVGGHDQDDPAEVDLAAEAVGEPAVVEHLQKGVVNVRVRLLDLVKQYDTERLAADGFGQSAALFVTDVARVCPDQLGHRVWLLEL